MSHLREEGCDCDPLALINITERRAQTLHNGRQSWTSMLCHRSNRKNSSFKMWHYRKNTLDLLAANFNFYGSDLDNTPNYLPYVIQQLETDTWCSQNLCVFESDSAVNSACLLYQRKQSTVQEQWCVTEDRCVYLESRVTPVVCCCGSFILSQAPS